MKKIQSRLLGFFALLIILASGVLIGYRLRNQSLPLSAGERQVVQMRLKDTLDKKEAVFSGLLVQIRSTEAQGDVLAARNGMTLYTFTEDTQGTSNCYKQCEYNWPPYLHGRYELGAADGIDGELGLTERLDGSHQLTYNNQPLYFFKNDKAPGDTFGHGINGVWFAARP